MVLGATFTLLFLFAVMGLSVDLGWAYYLKTRVQTAADAAANAAAVYAKFNSDTCGNVSCGTAYTCAGVSPPTTSLQAGCLYATSDGPPAFTATLIENNTAPPGVTGVSPFMWIKATVSTTAPNLFLYGSGFQTASIAAQAIVAVTKVPASSCIYLLSPTGTGLTVKGTAAVSTSNCAIYIDSSDSAALTKTGSGDITSTVNIVGNYSKVGSGSITPAPNTGQPTVSDPLAALPAPSYSGCDHTNYSTSSSASLTSGVYCGGISITGSGTITLGSGTYIMNGGGFSVAGSAKVTGSNIFIYNTAKGSETVGPISFAGSGAYTLSAPGAGVYTGILMFQDRAYSTAATVNGSTSSVETGTLYFPDASLTYTGSTVAQFTAIVASTLTLVGSTALANDTVGTYTGLTITKAALIQ
jgi:hypothetical protein